MLLQVIPKTPSRAGTSAVSKVCTRYTSPPRLRPAPRGTEFRGTTLYGLSFGIDHLKLFFSKMESISDTKCLQKVWTLINKPVCSPLLNVLQLTMDPDRYIHHQKKIQNFQTFISFLLFN
jgi:hypothetical protein